MRTPVPTEIRAHGPERHSLEIAALPGEWLRSARLYHLQQQERSSWAISHLADHRLENNHLILRIRAIMLIPVGVGAPIVGWGGAAIPELKNMRLARPRVPEHAHPGDRDHAAEERQAIEITFGIHGIELCWLPDAAGSLGTPWGRSGRAASSWESRA